MTSRLHERYAAEVVPALQKQFEYGNPNEVPRVAKIVVNIGLGEALTNAKALDAALGDLTTITGQKPIVLKAKKSVSNFKVREGYETSAMVTLRRDRMWHFLDRLVNLAAPRIKDFRGVNDKAFDKQGNYSMGLTEQGVFPEINMAEATFTHGMHINFVFNNSTPELSRFILAELGMPFVKPEENKKKSSK